MFNKKVMVALVDINSIQDDSGNRTILISKIKKTIAYVDLVGVVTLQLAQAQSIKLNYSIEINRMYYDKEVYCYIIDENELCKVESLGKAKQTYDMLLNVSVIKDDEIINAIKSFLQNQVIV